MPRGGKYRYLVNLSKKPINSIWSLQLPGFHSCKALHGRTSASLADLHGRRSVVGASEAGKDALGAVSGSASDSDTPFDTGSETAGISSQFGIVGLQP